MKKNSKLLLSLSICTCFALNAIAEEKTDLGEVSISDTALEAQIKSITSEKLENLQASDIKDILKSMPSVIVDGNARYSQKVYIRGLEDKSSNITIDGAKMSGQLFHHNGDQTIDAEMLEIGSIELGPNSALSGAGVINGSFVYKTKDPSDYLEDGETFGGKISAGYQSAFDRKSLDVAVFAKVNEQLEFVGITNLSEDNKLSIPDSDDIETKKSKLKSGLLKFIYKANDANTFKVSYNRYEDGGLRQFAGEKAGGTTLASYEVDNDITRDTYTLNYEYTPDNELINLDTNIYFSSQELFYDEVTSPTTWWSKSDSALEPAKNYINENSGIDLRNTSLLQNHKVTYGLSYGEEEQRLEGEGERVYTSGALNGTSESVDFDAGEIKEYALYIEDEIELDKFLLTFGARYDTHELGGVYSGKNSQLSPKFKGEYQANDNLKLRIAYGKIFKGPELGETYLTGFPLPAQAGDTKAQTGHNYEVGFDYDLSNSLDADNSIFGFTAYTYNVDNYMHPTSNVALSNESDMRIWGLESVFRYQKDALGFSLSHTYTGGEAEDLVSGKKYDPFTTKIHAFKVDIDYKLNDEFYFNYNSEFVPGNKLMNSWQTEDAERKGYGVNNISTTYTPTGLKGAKIHFGIDNLFDKKYARHTAFGTYWGAPDSGSYEVGRNFKFKLSYKF